jgi:hypothetical protein
MPENGFIPILQYGEYPSFGEEVQPEKFFKIGKRTILELKNSYLGDRR